MALTKEKQASRRRQATRPQSPTGVLKSWPEKSREVAQTIIGKYGPPDETTLTRLTWFNNGPWTRTVVHREEIPHKFPKPHTDIVEQFVTYRVPPGSFAALAAFDGSVHAKRTEGELSARCDKEEMNFLALNLAHEIIEGRMGAEQARHTYTEEAMKSMAGMETTYLDGLHFAPQADAADPDQQTVTKTMKEEIQKKLGIGKASTWKS